MARIPQETVDRVRDTADIIDVVSQVVDLRRRGANFFGLCPFHDEKTPSFSVAPAKQIYHCFGCSNGGNVFSFLMEYQKLTFPEAVKTLADRYNIPIEYERGRDDSTTYSNLYEIHEQATKLYMDNLYSPRGEQALNYLKERGLSEDILKQFRIGFAIDSWDQLNNYVNVNELSKDEVMKSGLFTQTDKGTFDRFRSRIMYPIFHPSGKVIAFGGRVFESDDPAKYLNSPETPLYQKSNVFYGLQASRDAIRKLGYAILVEGYMDFLQLYQAGIHPVVSVSGTAFTQRHAWQLSKFTQKIILLYDGDDAGGTAAVRAGFVLLKAGLEAQVVRPPKELDPDDWVRQTGQGEVETNIENAQDFLDFHLEFFQALALRGATRREYIHNLLREIKEIRDNIFRDELIRILAERLKVNESDLVKVMRGQRSYRQISNENQTAGLKRIEFTSREERAQIELLQLLVTQNVDIRNMVRTKVTLDMFTHPLLQKLAEQLLTEKMVVDTAAIIEYFTDKLEREIVTEILFSERDTALPEQIVNDCLKTLKLIPVKKRIMELRINIREKEAQGQNPKTELNEIMKLQQELNDI